MEIDMEIRICNGNDITAVGAFYDKVVMHLEQTINYPKWEYKVYPCEETVRSKVEVNQQYACWENNDIIGAFVLNENSLGKYENADWRIALSEGLY